MAENKDETPALEAPIHAAPAVAYNPKTAWGFLLGVVIAALFAVDWLQDAQGGTLTCSRAENQCEIERGWLLRDHERFPATELRGATLVKVSQAGMTGSIGRYAVEVKITGDKRRLAGASSDREEQGAIAQSIDAFAQDPNAATFAVHEEANIFVYIFFTILACGYFVIGIGLFRARARSLAV